VSTSLAILEIDTDKLTGSCQLTASGEPNSENLLRQRYAFPDGSSALQVITWTKESKDKRTLLNLSRLELVDLSQKKAKTLREIEGGSVLFPSPNGKFVAVRWFENDQNGKEANESIWVINQDGRIVAKTEVPK